MTAASAGRWLPMAVLWLAACALAFVIILPVRTGQVGYDSAASVLYFDRIAAGQRLEAFVTATPKPLLTVVYGAIHSVTGDWRPLSWVAIAVHGLAVVLAAELARRIGGSRAGAFAAIAMIGSSSLLLDVSLAYAVAWALAGWLAAALAVTRTRPRWDLAGIALLIAGMARIETLIIVALAALAIGAGSLVARRRGSAAPPRSAWAAVAIAAGAVPIQLGHDWLLTGDPLWSFSVPVAGSIGAPLLGPIGALGLVTSHIVAMAPLAVLALLGLAVAIRRRSWPVVLGLLAIGPGVAAFVVALGLRGIYVSDRYLTPVDLAIVFASAIGFSALKVPELPIQLPRPALLLGSALVAAALSSPFAPADRQLFAAVRSNLAFHREADATKPVHATILDGIPAVRDRPARPQPSLRSPADATLVVPALLRPELAVDLRLPLDQITEGLGREVRDDGTFPRAGQIVFHDRRGDRPPEAFAFLEVDRPTTLGAIRLVPLHVDGTLGTWIVRVEPASLGGQPSGPRSRVA